MALVQPGARGNGQSPAASIMPTMRIGIPDGIAERPRAATRYMARGSPPWRITVVLQGARGLDQVRGDDRIAGPRSPSPAGMATGPIWGVSIVLAGSLLVVDPLRGAEIALRAGGWFLFAGRPTAEVRMQPGPGFLEMAISCDAGLGGIVDALGLWPQEWAAQADADAGVVHAGLELHRALLDPAVPDAGLLRRLVCLLDLVRGSGGDGNGSFAGRACSILAHNTQPGFAIADAARAMGIAEQVFRKRFTREVGVAPGRWQQQRRMERASGLLAVLPVSTVAARLGYGNVASFSRQFRKVTGVTPQMMRRLSGMRPGG